MSSYPSFCLLSMCPMSAACAYCCRRHVPSSIFHRPPFIFLRLLSIRRAQEVAGERQTTRGSDFPPTRLSWSEASDTLHFRITCHSSSTSCVGCWPGRRVGAVRFASDQPPERDDLFLSYPFPLIQVFTPYLKQSSAGTCIEGRCPKLP